MDQSPLVSEQVEAGARFLSEFEKTIPVLAAFWLKANEGDPWYFYVTSNEISDKTIRTAYGEVLRVVGEMCDPNFSPFRVKLIKPSDPMAKAAVDLLKRYPGKIPARIHDGYFGSAGAHDVYIYPAMTQVS